MMKKKKVLAEAIACKKKKQQQDPTIAADADIQLLAEMGEILQAWTLSMPKTKYLAALNDEIEHMYLTHIKKVKNLENGVPLLKADIHKFRAEWAELSDTVRIVQKKRSFFEVESTSDSD